MQTLLGGVVTGLIYDLVVRGLFGGVKNNTGAKLVFLFCAFGVALASLISASDLYLRFYMALGFGSGVALYFIVFSGFVVSAINAVRQTTHKIASAVYKPVKSAGVRFAVKNEKTIHKIKSAVKKTVDIPKKLKISYNKYAKYFFGERNSGSPHAASASAHSKRSGSTTEASAKNAKPKKEKKNTVGNNHRFSRDDSDVSV